MSRSNSSGPDRKSLQQFFQGWTSLRAQRGSAGVVFSGEFPRAGLRGDENDRKIKMRIAVVRVVGESLKDLLLCLLLSSFLAGGDTEVIVRRGAFWIDRDRVR